MDGRDKVVIIRNAQYAFHRAMEAIERRETSLSALARLRDAADVARRPLELGRDDDFPIAQSCRVKLSTVTAILDAWLSSGQ
jgi:predicted neuraminidase